MPKKMATIPRIVKAHQFEASKGRIATSSSYGQYCQSKYRAKPARTKLPRRPGSAKEKLPGWEEVHYANELPVHGNSLGSRAPCGVRGALDNYAAPRTTLPVALSVRIRWDAGDRR